MGATSAADRHETRSERADRNFAEVVQELRVAQTGVQILFAFLLSLAFLSKFPADDATYAAVLTAALLTAAGATVCFVGPVAAHRLHFQRGQKVGIVQLTHRLALVGLALLAAAMILSVWLVLAFLWDAGAATWAAGGMTVAVVVLWVVLPAVVLHDPAHGDDDAA
jgi:hypothetical protein